MAGHEKVVSTFVLTILVLMVGVAIYASYNLGQASSLTLCEDDRDVGKREVGRICTKTYQWEWDHDAP